MLNNWNKNIGKKKKGQSKEGSTKASRAPSVSS